MYVIDTIDPIAVPATDTADARLVWIELEIVALDLPEQWLVIHVMPTALRRNR